MNCLRLLDQIYQWGDLRLNWPFCCDNFYAFRRYSYTGAFCSLTQRRRNVISFQTLIQDSDQQTNREQQGHLSESRLPHMA